MSPEDNWNEYRLMILDWHNQDLAEKREIRERLESHEKAVTTQLTAIQTTLAEMKAIRAHKITALNLAIPALVSLIVLLGESVLAHVWR